MVVKELLDKIKNLNFEIDNDLALYKYYVRESHKLPNLSFDRIQSSGTKKSNAYFEVWICKALDKKNEIEAKQILLLEYKSSIINALEKNGMNEHALILIYRDLNNLKYEEIMSLMHLSRASVYRIYKESRNKFDNLKI